MVRCRNYSRYYFLLELIGDDIHNDNRGSGTDYSYPNLIKIILPNFFSISSFLWLSTNKQRYTRYICRP